MGMANRAPKERRDTHFKISKHAIGRFRERVEEEHLSRDDRDLELLLDERIRVGKKLDMVDNVADKAASTIYEFTNQRATAIYYALVRDNTVVTVIDEAMGRQNMSTGQWSMRFNSPFAAALKDVAAAATKLTPVVSAIPLATVPASLAPPAPTPPPVPVAAPESPANRTVDPLDATLEEDLVAASRDLATCMATRKAAKAGADAAMHTLWLAEVAEELAKGRLNKIVNGTNAVKADAAADRPCKVCGEVGHDARRHSTFKKKS